jgi:hypothetical protein
VGKAFSKSAHAFCSIILQCRYPGSLKTLQIHPYKRREEGEGRREGKSRREERREEADARRSEPLLIESQLDATDSPWPR